MALRDDWFSLPESDRQAEYRVRAAVLDRMVQDIREHREARADCPGAPLCPGMAAGEKVKAIGPESLPDLLLTCLAGLADRDEAIDRLHAELVQATTSAMEQADRLGRELEYARRDADEGWSACRAMMAAQAAKLEG